MAGSQSVVLVGGLQIYGSVVRHGNGLRLRVRSHEWAALGFSEGQTVGVTVPPDDERELLIASVFAVPDQELSLVNFTPPIHPRKRPRSSN